MTETGFKMSTKREETSWGSSLQGKCGKSMRWQLWLSSLGGNSTAGLDQVCMNP